MTTELRRAAVNRDGPLVVKVGTNVLTNATGALDRERMASLVGQVCRCRSTRRPVVLVSSGAIGAGVGRLGLERRPQDLPHLQACAAVGQSALMQAYQECLTPHGVQAAQILLTASDLDSRVRYLNIRNTIFTLFEYGCLPIINENDTVSVAEIRFGDNDHLAALVASLIKAPLLVLLTNVPGLMSGDPTRDPTARRVDVVPEIDQTVLDLADARTSRLGTGGMRSKLRASRLATAAGTAVIMADGGQDGVLDAILAGESVGTLFLARGRGWSARRRWLGLTARPRGQVRVDEGARRAVMEKGRSLLPIGVQAVVGTFSRGDVVSICDATGVEFARGLTNYASADVERIRGLTTEQIQRVLGKVPYVELIHRDNLALLER